MKAYINNGRYSGACYLDPWMELTEEASQELYDLIHSNKTPLDRKTPHKYSGWPLGPESFYISYFNDEFQRDMNINSYPGRIQIDEYIFSKTEICMSPPFIGEPKLEKVIKNTFVDTAGVNEYIVSLFNAIVEDTEGDV